MTSALDLTASAISNAVLRSASLVGDRFPEAGEVLNNATALIFTGMGKSGFIAQKAASTFRSLGMPSHYVHPADASHGDMGALSPKTAVVVLSNSGETGELSDLLRFCQENGLPMVAITVRGDSTLGKAATVALCYGPVQEACPNGLAPTTSTSVALMLCDALAVQYATDRKLTPSDFNRLHPGGKLGKRLRPVAEVMHRPTVVSQDCSLLDAAGAMTGTVAGVALVVGMHGVIGVFTDGDLRRAIEAKVGTVGEGMTTHPLSICETALCEDAAALMQESRVTKLFVEDALGSVVGVLNLHDCQ